jgi:hypothetical protein
MFVRGVETGGRMHSTLVNTRMEIALCRWDLDFGKETSIGYRPVLELPDWGYFDRVVQEAIKGLEGSITIGGSASRAYPEGAVFEGRDGVVGGEMGLSEIG